MEYENTVPEREFGWNDEIKNDGADFVLLPEGDYPFTVSKFERSRFDGSAKLPPCNMAVLTLCVDGGDKGATTITHRLYLHSKCEGLLCAFFTCIGQRQKGESLHMNWDKVVGSGGKARIEVHEYTKRDGTDGQSNQVKRFLAPEEPKAAPAQGGWQQGVFQ